jgi:folate-binding protein YgfZ
MGADDNDGMSDQAFPAGPSAAPATDHSETAAGTVAAPSGVLRLNDWALIRAQGADARKFLQGQLTQDVLGLQPGRARLAGFCSAKGRLQASFVVWAGAADEVLLACSADLLPALLKRLQMFVLRAQCKLSDASAETPLWGWAGRSVQAALGESLQGAAPPAPWQVVQAGGAVCIGLPPARVAGDEVPRWLQVGGNVAAGVPALELPAWTALEVLSGVPRIVAATVDQFVPQMVNLELVGGVNFQKGCYPGQEVVARSQYRGTLKRRAQVLLGDSPLRPGQEIYHPADPEQPAGQVVLAGALPGLGAVALAELKLAAADGQPLHAGEAGGPVLQLGALPYALPAEQG